MIDLRATQAESPMNESEAPSRRILVVDDYADAANCLARLLRVLGHQVLSAYTGPGTLAAARQFLPHVIFLDIGMPEMSGYDVAKQLREIPELSSTVIVALTGWGREEDRRLAKEAGFDHHLLKPAGPSDLQQILEGLKSETP
jgi:CheY-like chemotaxis protein